MLDHADLAIVQLLDGEGVLGVEDTRPKYPAEPAQLLTWSGLQHGRLEGHGAGREARSLLTTYFACGNLDELTGWFGQAGLRVTATVTHTGSARFPSADALVTTEVESTPLGERISAEVYDRIKRAAREVLAPFTADDGTLEAPFRVHVVAARR